MDPTTSAYIDPSMLESAPPSNFQDIPSLTVKPTTTSTTTSPTTAYNTTSDFHIQDTSTSAKATSVADKAAESVPSATGIRQRVNHLQSNLTTQLDHATDHPAVKNAKGIAQSQIQQFREILGRSATIRDLEKRTNIDRVFLVVGGVFTYLLLIPFNLFGLALPTTTFLTLAPPALLAIEALDSSETTVKDEKVKNLLSYFVVLGFVQFLESLAAGLLERKIPQYYTLKLVLLAYLLHPKTQGAIFLHQKVLKPALTAVQTPSSSPAGYSVGGNVNTPPTSTSGAAPSSPVVVLPSGGGTGVGLTVEK